ncbi:MAG TPA: hypothetical protein VK563_08660 [Puia sp.]|nr:hypothetical protein [Puia sp.]
MNKIISTTRKSFGLFILATFLSFTAGSLTARASNEPREHHTGSATNAEVKYIGNNEGNPLFNVLYNNSTGARFTVRILDGDGNQIFMASYADKKFDKKFKLATPELSNKLVFIIRNNEDHSEQSFEVSTDSRLVEEIEVKEVK